MQMVQLVKRTKIKFKIFVFVRYSPSLLKDGLVLRRFGLTLVFLVNDTFALDFWCFQYSYTQINNILHIYATELHR